jgi:hypothetical protein
MATIQARVNARLLTKASRLFTGTLAGRIIEILQNARRAGAKHVVITQRKGLVTVRDDGRGIRDFAKLLDLGGSDWEAKLEASEDPAGVGLFSLAPRKLTIRSRGHKVIIDGPGWTGTPVEVLADPQGLPICPPDIAAGLGTELEFPDDPWDSTLVKSRAVFSGLDVTVDGEPCPKERFLPGRAAPYRELGCRIQVVPETAVTHWHRNAALNHNYGDNLLLDFHGQVVAFSYHPTSHHNLHFFVELTGQPTGIRLMLPARTCLVENDALTQLKAALEREAFLYLKRQGHHRLPYKEYRRAHELGIALPESEPVYHVGMLRTDMAPEPVEVSMPKGHALARCYRLADTKDREDSDEANIHLLAALGQFDPTLPLVPVEINPAYDGYSWATLPTIRRVTVSAGKPLQESWVNGTPLVCVDNLSITIRCSDGKIFRSEVCLAVKPPDSGPVETWCDRPVYITPAAQQRMAYQEVWFHLGGFSDDGDTYDTQEDQVRKELDEFWLRLVGPYETLRKRLLTATEDLPEGWQQVILRADGQITIRQADGSDKILAAPDAQEVAS